MASLAATALQNNAASDDVAKAAVKDATAGMTTEAEKEALALALYKEATGRFPQDSSDRQKVYQGAYVLIGVVFVVTAGVAVFALATKTTVPQWLAVLATGLISGVVGGLFGYAKQ